MTEKGKRWIWLSVGLTLLIGFGLGVIVDRLLLTPTVFSSDELRVHRAHRRNARHEDHAQRSRDFLTTLNRELGLSGEQQRRVEDSLEANHGRAREFWSSAREDFSKLRQEFRADIREVLDPVQRKRFDQLVAEHDARRQQGQGVPK